MQAGIISTIAIQLCTVSWIESLIFYKTCFVHCQKQSPAERTVPRSNNFVAGSFAFLFAFSGNLIAASFMRRQCY
jgi:hypothetical protein